MLELKESNSPYWLIGAGKNGTFSGSNTNVPCYYKSSKKHLDLAKELIENNDNVDDVFLLNGVAWDNMPSSNSKEELGYLKNKGRLILSRNQLGECDYPKGVSRDPLPKKGVKTYTSIATALENKGDDDMNLELNDKAIINEDIDDIPETLQDVFFAVMADSRPEDFKKFTKEELVQFAEFVKELPEEEITTSKRNLLLCAISMAYGDDLTVTESIDLTEQLEQPNEYCKEFKTGDVVKFIRPGDEESDEDAIIVGYDEDGFYKVKWSDGKTSCGLHDKNLKLISKSDLKESKIVAPVGNPQTAGSFVNIDVDLDHMEVSDFIVRLAQSIRSEQNSVLEYVALRSANGITNEERTVIDQIIEEEKNHMVAMTTLLYKQLLTNHQQNVDGANNEFVLPKLGMEIFDNSKDGKLTESVMSTVNKIIALEETFNSIDELIKELKTDTNYDEIAYHINCYAKTNKSKALELMDKLFDLERNKSPKECRDELISMLTQTEDVIINSKGETENQTQWDIVVDVNYDTDFYMQVNNNITNAIEELNPIFENEYHCKIDEKKYTLAKDKFNFTLSTYNNFNDNVNEAFITKICNKLFDRASVYEYYIGLV